MAAPPPPSRRRPASLEDLSFDTQRMILIRIPCAVDRGRMSLVCRAWRKVIRHQRSELEGSLLPLPPPLPWLLLRAPFPVGLGSTRAACVLSGGRVHHYLDVAPPDARCFGSHDGAWLLLDARHPHAGAHQAINVHTGAVLDLPRVLGRQTDAYVHSMVIHAAALSSSPEDARCVGAAIVTSWRDPAPGAAPPPRRRCIAFWRRGWPTVFDYVPPGDGDIAFDAEDVIYLRHSGAFAFVTRGEHLRRFTPHRQLNNMMAPYWETDLFRPTGRIGVRARYLVVSGGELLMVVRFTPHPDHQPASKFKVFRVIKRNEADVDADFPVAQYRWSWSELNTLGDRMLFVGHGCSRSYKANQYPGFEAGIYFLDDGTFYDDAVIFGNGDVTRYPCSDNGKWTEDGHVQHCFARSDPSDHSAPVWLLP
ncbi:unnamed protein product [Urochloa decumbens]|uniref:KIB1-4 beta-propeller domain-containing protein n=1 Tax=Urochloa decumbens TaxID=240449 RepID=A0ABC8YUW6_9POAL